MAFNIKNFVTIRIITEQHRRWWNLRTAFTVNWEVYITELEKESSKYWIYIKITVKYITTCQVPSLAINYISTSYIEKVKRKAKHID